MLYLHKYMYDVYRNILRYHNRVKYYEIKSMGVCKNGLFPPIVAY